MDFTVNTLSAAILALLEKTNGPIRGITVQMTVDLSFPQWVSGQLTNIYNFSDPVLFKQALLQVIMATRDAASLPWPVVRNAWAVSMHEVEEGSLDWSQTTQWSLNRLSALQLDMTSTNATTHHKKTL